MNDTHSGPRILAFVGSGGKTTLLKQMANRYREQGKTVLITPTTHTFKEPDTLLTDDPETIIRSLKETGCVTAGTDGINKVNPLSRETFRAVIAHADVVLVEADGSRMKPLKFPKKSEPVLPEQVDEIFVVCGLNAIGRPAREVCHRLELVKACLGIGDDTRITPDHLRRLVTEGYLHPLRAAYPRIPVTLLPRHNGTPEQTALAEQLKGELNG